MFDRLDKLKLLKWGKQVEFKPIMGRFKKIFSEEYEQLLESYVRDLTNRFLPLFKKEFCNLHMYKLTILNYRIVLIKKKMSKSYYVSMSRYPV